MITEKPPTPQSYWQPASKLIQINLKLAISNIYKICALTPLVFESGVLKALLSHGCIIAPSVRLLLTGQHSTQINSKTPVLGVYKQKSHCNSGGFSRFLPKSFLLRVITYTSHLPHASSLAIVRSYNNVILSKTKRQSQFHTAVH